MKWLLPVLLLLGAVTLGGCLSAYRVSVTPAEVNDASLDRIADFLAAEGFARKTKEIPTADGGKRTIMLWEGKMSGNSILWGQGAITISAEVYERHLTIYLHHLANGDPKLLRSFGMKLAAKLKEAFPEAEVTLSWIPYIQLALKRTERKTSDLAEAASGRVVDC